MLECVYWWIGLVYCFDLLCREGRWNFACVFSTELWVTLLNSNVILRVSNWRFLLMFDPVRLQRFLLLWRKTIISLRAKQVFASQYFFLSSSHHTFHPTHIDSLPLGLGLTLGSLTVGRLVDRGFRITQKRIETGEGVKPLPEDRAKMSAADLAKFPLEHARLRMLPICEYPSLLLSHWVQSHFIWCMILMQTVWPNGYPPLYTDGLCNIGSTWQHLSSYSSLVNTHHSQKIYLSLTETWLSVWR